MWLSPRCEALAAAFFLAFGSKVANARPPTAWCLREVPGLVLVADFLMVVSADHGGSFPVRMSGLMNRERIAGGALPGFTHALDLRGITEGRP